MNYIARVPIGRFVEGDQIGDLSEQQRQGLLQDGVIQEDSLSASTEHQDPIQTSTKNPTTNQESDSQKNTVDDSNLGEKHGE